MGRNAIDACMLLGSQSCNEGFIALRRRCWAYGNGESARCELAAYPACTCSTVHAQDGDWRGKQSSDLIQKTSLKLFLAWQKRKGTCWRVAVPATASSVRARAFSDCQTSKGVAQARVDKFVSTYPIELTDVEEPETDIEDEVDSKEAEAEAAAPAGGAGKPDKKSRASSKASTPAAAAKRSTSPLKKK